MQTLQFSPSSRYTLAPTRDVGEFRAKLAKCNGKTKRAAIRSDGARRAYPKFGPAMSTADYVRAFESANSCHQLKAWQWQTLNDAPCTLYSGEDSHKSLPEQYATWEEFDAAQSAAPDPILPEPAQPVDMAEPLEPADHAHLGALRLRLSNERARLESAQSGAEVDMRRAWVAQIEREIAAEERLIGIVGSASQISDEELLTALQPDTPPAESGPLATQSPSHAARRRAPADSVVRFRSLRVGDAFRFDEGGPVWIRCRGGFRLGLGGPLHACGPSAPVLPYSLGEPIGTPAESPAITRAGRVCEMLRTVTQAAARTRHDSVPTAQSMASEADRIDATADQMRAAAPRYADECAEVARSLRELAETERARAAPQTTLDEPTEQMRAFWRRQQCSGQPLDTIYAAIAQPGHQQPAGYCVAWYARDAGRAALEAAREPCTSVQRFDPPGSDPLPATPEAVEAIATAAHFRRRAAAEPEHAGAHGRIAARFEARAGHRPGPPLRIPDGDPRARIPARFAAGYLYA